MDEGYIKFNCEWIEGCAPVAEKIKEINEVRNRLFSKGMIGVYPNGIGFGNISARDSGVCFHISGTQTGGIPVLNESHYTLVENYDIKNNSLRCRGPLKASSESLTHAAVYVLLPGAACVIHVHNSNIWNKYKNILPTTPASAKYGSPEIAFEIQRIISRNGSKPQGIIIMGGHEDGIIAYGKSAYIAEELLMKLFD